MKGWGTKREGRNEVSSLVLRYGSLYLENFHLHLLQWRYVSGKKTKSGLSVSQFKTFCTFSTASHWWHIYIICIYILSAPDLISALAVSWLFLAAEVASPCKPNCSTFCNQPHNGRLMVLVTIAVERSYTHSGQTYTKWTQIHIVNTDSTASEGKWSCNSSFSSF